VGGTERVLIEGYEEITLWDLSGEDIGRVGVETSIMIEFMAMEAQSSSKAMEKEIT
jgi:hypothetical protein